MTESRVDAVLETLQEEETRLDSRREGMKAELSTIDGELKRVRAALGALSGNGSKSKPGRKPQATLEDVSAAIAEVLAQEDVAQHDALRKTVLAKLSHAGKSGRGLAARFDEVLQDERFVDTGEGYRLRGDSEVGAEQQAATNAWSGGG